MIGQQVAAPNNIESSLSKIRDELVNSNDQAAFRISAASNIILVSASNDSKNDSVFSEFQDAFVSAQPARFFLIKHTNLDLPQFGVSAVCHLLGKKEHVCSEIISIDTPTSYLPKVASILRSHILPGLVTECCLLDEDALSKVFTSIMQVPDVIYVDSLKIKNGIKAVAEIHDSCRKLIDLNWVRLSGFRDSIRIGFDLFNNTASLHKLNKVIISSLVDPSDTHSDSSSKLLAGWIKSMLNTINLEFKFNHHNFEKYSHIPGLLPGSICSVEFKGEDNISIVVEVIQSGNLIIKCVQDNNNCSFNRTSEYNSNLEVSSAALLKRMILVGESQRNFRSALLSALTL